MNGSEAAKKKSKASATLSCAGLFVALAMICGTAIAIAYIVYQ